MTDRAKPITFPGDPLAPYCIAPAWQVGDLVMYDNRAALHRARPYAITEHARVLHRTTVAGEGPTVQ